MTPGGTTHGTEYRNASMPTVLAKRIVRVIRGNPGLGYRTLSDFVRHAASDKLRQVESHLALVAVHEALGGDADAIHALLLDTLPPEYQSLLSSEAGEAVAKPGDEPPGLGTSEARPPF